MGKSDTSHHGRLEKLREAEAKERTAARELATKATAASAAADEARQRLVQAHANGTDVKGAEKRRTQAQAQAEDLAIRVEAAGIRVERAEAARQKYEAEHAQQLIGELQPEAQAVAARLASSARELVEADREWDQVRGKIDALLAAMPNATPRMDSQTGHRLAEVARAARNALRSGEVESPMPTWQGLRAHEQSQAAARAARNAA